MLEGCAFWPAEFAAGYRTRGWWEGVTITQMLARSAEHSPAKTALVCAGQRLSYRDLVQTSDRLACLSAASCSFVGVRMASRSRPQHPSNGEDQGKIMRLRHC